MLCGEEPLVGTLWVRDGEVRIADVRASIRDTGDGHRRLSFFVQSGNVQVGDEIQLNAANGLEVFSAQVVARIPAKPNDDGEHFDAKIHGMRTSTYPMPDEPDKQ